MRRTTIGIAALVCFLVALAAGPARGAPGIEPTRAAYDAYLDAVMESTGLPGMSVVVTHGDEIVYSAGYGSDADGDPVTARTPMRIASLSKAFTAMAVLTLVDEGAVALDEPVAEQLPEFRAADPRAAEVTVRQLLNQTSGLSDTTVDIGAAQAAGSLAEYVSTLSTATLSADPGTEWQYCNVNYNLAARLVEVVSGRTFDDYLRERVFEPLGMTHSSLDDRTVTPADGFNSLFGSWVSRPELPGFLNHSGSGGVITNAADMGKWLAAHTGTAKRLLTPASTAAMYASSPVHEYGMGWGTENVAGAELLSHGGNLFTYTASAAIVPATGYGFAVLTNSATLYDDTYDVLAGLVTISRGGSPDIPGGGRQRFELVLGLLAVAGPVCGVFGALRAHRWARKRLGNPKWRIALRLVPVLLPLLLLAGYPALASFLMNGRTVTWSQLTYFAAPLTITLVLAALSGTTVAAVRLWRLRSVCSDG